jgi:predicted TIM-barrel fold metal-dependent hydrolase
LIIDGHIHAGYWSPGQFLGRGVSFDDLDRCMRECSIGGAVLTSTDLRENDSVIDFMKGSSNIRYWFFPWVNPSVEGDLGYIEKRRVLINGIKLHPSCDRIKVTDARVKPFLEFARREHLPVMVHCGRWQEMSSYEFAIEVARGYPDIDLILSHMGGDTPELETATIKAIKQGNLTNVYLGIEGVREYWAVQRAVEEIGADRIIFGSDFPLGHPKMYLGLVDALSISDTEKGLILEKNMLGLLGEAE